MKSVARIVTRLQGKGDGLFLGTLLKNGEGWLQPGSIYEVVDCHGSLFLSRVWDACPAVSDETVMESPIRAHWSQDIGDILSSAGKYLFLTRDEVTQIVKEERGE